MSLILTILLSLGAGRQFPELKIADPVVLSAFDFVSDSLLHNSDRGDLKFFFIAKLETIGGKRYIFIEPGITLSGFKTNLPDKYSKHKGRFIFWYDGDCQTRVHSDEKFGDFEDEFGRYMLGGGIPDNSNSYGKDFWPHQILEGVSTYRFELGTNAIVGIIDVCGPFPYCDFVQSGYHYNESGDFLVGEGVYAICSLDRPFDPRPKGYDLWDYIRNRSQFSKEITRYTTFSYHLTVDTTGRVEDVKLVGNEGEFNDRVNKEIVRIILGSPNWNVATVQGRKVKYRKSIGIYFPYP